MTVFWTNHDLLLKRLRDAAAQVRQDCPEVKEVRLFGSVARHRETAASDADLLLIVESTDAPVLRRAERYQPYFDTVGFPVELFVYTVDEAASQEPALLKTALETGYLITY